LRHAVKAVAARHGLTANRLNDDAAPWAPATLEVSVCEVLLERCRLRVLGLPLVRHEFASSAEVMAAYYAAFPNEDPADDPYLGDFVVTELANGGFELPLK
jgi:hypothetical protein